VGTYAASQLARVPLLGAFSSNEGVRRQAGLITEGLIEASLKNSRAPVDEQNRLRALVSVSPTISDPEKYRSDLVGIANTLYREYRDAVTTMNSGTSTQTMRNEARQKAQATTNLLNQIVPPVYDVATLNRKLTTPDGTEYTFLQSLPEGTTFMYLNPRTNKLEAKTISKRGK
jgi:hypothetical protein